MIALEKILAWIDRDIEKSGLHTLTSLVGLIPILALALYSEFASGTSIAEQFPITSIGLFVFAIAWGLGVLSRALFFGLRGLGRSTPDELGQEERIDG